MVSSERVKNTDRGWALAQTGAATPITISLEGAIEAV